LVGLFHIDIDVANLLGANNFKFFFDAGCGRLGGLHKKLAKQESGLLQLLIKPAV
jgi:hypothetical protein